MNNRFVRSLQFSLGTLDFITINAVFFSTEYIFRKQVLISPNVEYFYLLFFLNAVWLAIAVAKNVYNEKYILSFESFSKVSMQAYLYFLSAIIIFLFFFRLILLSRVFITVVLSSIFISLLINRFLYLGIYYYFKKRLWMVSKVVIIGYNPLSKKLVEYLSEDSLNKEVVGFCEETENVKELSNYPILSNVSQTLEVCKQYGVTEIYSTVAPEQNHSLYGLIQGADENCIRFKIVPDLGFFFKKQMHIDYLKEIPVISLRREPLEDMGNRIKKRIFDIVVSFFVVVFILSWLVPVVGLLIWLESRGKVFFVQPRTGKNNNHFGCLKFRSMKTNNTANLQQATKNDSRVTRIGRFLRRTSLDEFPQFINVLRGDMSIVGPRPHMLEHTDQYARLIGQYMVRQFLKPGITGWAQVNGHRGETRRVEQMQKRVDHDLWYLENWSLFLDMKIMAMTAFKTVKGDKNAF
ncbi:MAG TPA: undecaprenyl-phosphate glucose phosphotransferase [Flavisolibacter sp.]|nr:undecaprenyl-phosphate glucose phosphotransferase [Flavisolibacter sp.]